VLSAKRYQRLAKLPRLARPADAKETAIVCLSAALVSPHGDAQNCPSAIIGYGGISFGR
jgi:hypothetical protein